MTNNEPHIAGRTPAGEGSGGDYVFTQLTAAGAMDGVKTRRFYHHRLQYTVAAINTSVTVRAEGSNDGSNWFNLSKSDSTTTQTANGTYGLHFVGRKVKYLRLNFVSRDTATVGTISNIKFLSG
jgi:hypothetical protein